MPDQITVHCRFFARYAEVMGLEQHVLRAPRGVTVEEAVARLKQDLPAASRLPDHPMAAVNRAHVPARHVLADGDELALLPPLAGG